jgi:ABC-type uncharacterized transport system auxiliary subunit
VSSEPMFTVCKLIKTKNKAMKKLFAIVTIISFLAACNNGSEEKAATTDTLKNAESPLMDAVNTADSASKKIQDSTGKMMDTVMKK